MILCLRWSQRRSFVATTYPSPSFPNFIISTKYSFLARRKYFFQVLRIRIISLFLYPYFLRKKAILYVLYNIPVSFLVKYWGMSHFGCSCLCWESFCFHIQPYTNLVIMLWKVGLMLPLFFPPSPSLLLSSCNSLGRWLQIHIITQLKPIKKYILMVKYSIYSSLVRLLWLIFAESYCIINKYLDSSI